MNNRPAEAAVLRHQSDPIITNLPIYGRIYIMGFWLSLLNQEVKYGLIKPLKPQLNM
jgi:hypothetical protein